MATGVYSCSPTEARDDGIDIDMHRQLRLPALALALAASLTVPAVASADEGDEIRARTGCAVAQTFLALGDTAWYMPVPGGTFSSGDAVSLAGGARVVSESNGQKRLLLPAGATATLEFACRDLLLPIVRLSARNAGLIPGVLRVDLLYRPAPGAQRRAATIATVVPGRALAPTAKLIWAAAPAGAELAGVRIAAVGVGAAIVADDVYVDPYRRR